MSTKRKENRRSPPINHNNIEIGDKIVLLCQPRIVAVVEDIRDGKYARELVFRDTEHGTVTVDAKRVKILRKHNMPEFPEDVEFYARTEWPRHYF